MTIHGTTIYIVMQFPALREFVKMGKPVWGTCAGLIFLANRAYGKLFSCHSHV